MRSGAGLYQEDRRCVCEGDGGQAGKAGDVVGRKRRAEDLLRSQSTPDELRGFLLTQLARFKVPRDIVFTAELPRNALGKVQHFRLREDRRA